MRYIYLLIILVFVNAAYAQDDLEIIKKSLGFTGKQPNSLIDLKILHTTKNQQDLHALVYIERYTNGGCNPRGTCGCGVDDVYISLTLQGDKLLAKKEIVTQSCAKSLESRILKQDDRLIILVDDIYKSCEGNDRIAGMSFFTYEYAKPETGITEIDINQYETLTEQPALVKIKDNPIQDSCFFVNHIFTTDRWGGAYVSSLVYEKIKPDNLQGKFIGYLRKGILISEDQSDGISIELNDRTDKLLTEHYHREFKRKPKRTINQLREIALRYYQDGNYEMAQVMFKIIELQYTDIIYKQNLSIINDLALSLYKQKKFDASESWSEKVLFYKKADNYPQHAAAAYYNLGLVFEARGNPSKALENYQLSYELKNTTSAQNAIKRLSNNN